MSTLSIELVQKLASKGLSCTEVADEVGVCISAVYSFCKRNSIILIKARRGGKNAKDMLGQKFGSLTVVRQVESRRKLAYWLCECICGNSIEYCGADLRAGKNTTCGCKTGIRNKRNWQGYGEIPKRYWSSLVNNADQRGILFELAPADVDTIWKAQAGRCKLSGLPISFEENSASLDRVDNSQGYVKGNVQWLHKHINKMKGTFNTEVFVELCKNVAEQLP